MKSRHYKLGTLRHTLADSEEWSIRILADYGYAYKYIAQLVFGKNTDRYVKLVGRVLRRYSIGVTAYRKGENDTGASVASTLLKRKACK